MSLERFVSPTLHQTLHSELVKLTLLAALVGLSVALITEFFLLFIGIMLESLFGHSDVTKIDYQWWMVAVPAVGGLLGGLIIHLGAKDASGHGVPVVMEAMATHNGRLDPRLGLTKACAAATCVGTGLSLGRVGPMLLIGSTFGSALAQKLHLSVEHTKILLACGAASAFGVAFNAPLGGVILVLELILTEFKTRSFIPLVVAAVFATSLGQVFEGGDPVFQFDDVDTSLTFSDPEDYWEVFHFMGLGLTAGVAGVLFIKLLYHVAWLSRQMRRLPRWLHPAIGGLLVGLLALASPSILSNGFTVIQAALRGDFVWEAMIVLVLVKVLATSLSIGSGGSGGVFTPSLFIGAMLGGGVAGGLAEAGFIDPDHVPIYAILGMASFCAATTRATLTAIVLFFEMTGEVSLILPLMFSCVLADGVSYRLSPQTIYTQKLADRGILIPSGREANVMEAMKVSEAMTTRVMTLPPTAPLNLAQHLMEETGHMAFPIVDRGQLLGIVTQTDVHHKLELEGSQAGERPIREVATTDLVLVRPDDTLAEALRKLGGRDIGHLPVVDPKDATKLIGFLTKGDIIMAYNHHLLSQKRQLEGPVSGL